MAKEVYNDDEDPMYEDNTKLEARSSLSRALSTQSLTSDEINGDKVEMRIAYLDYAPSTVCLELKGLASFGEDNSHVGVDIVAILDISTTNMLDNESWKILQKRAMELFISKLRPIDRLSIVVLSERLCPLRSMMTEDAKLDIGLLVNACIEEGIDIQGNITASLKEALRVLDDRTHSDGRQAGILLLSRTDATGDAIEVSLGNIPVHVLALGADFTYDVLKQLANKSINGGTFSVVNVEDKESISKLRSAFSPCFCQLFTVVAQDLKLSIALPMVKYEQGPTRTRFPPSFPRITLTNIISNDEGEDETSKVKLRLITEVVKSGMFYQTWLPDVVDSSANISLGNLYCQETRKLALVLFLPWTSNREDVFNEEKYVEDANFLKNTYFTACKLHDVIDKDADAEGLKITCSYSDGDVERNVVVPVKLETEMLCSAPHIPSEHNRILEKQAQTFDAVKHKIKSIRDNAKTEHANVVSVPSGMHNTSSNKARCVCM